MAARETTSLRDPGDTRARGTATRGSQVSLVVDRPAPDGRGVLVLPFAAPDGEAAVGRHAGLLLERRLHQVPDLTVGHAALIASSPGVRRYLTLQRALSAEQAVACSTSWGAVAVLYGAITLRPRLRWDVSLEEVATRRIVFADTLEGPSTAFLDAPGAVAGAVLEALGIAIGPEIQHALDQRETDQLPALLHYLQAVDLRPQHQISQNDPEAMRRHLLRALALDPNFAPPAAMLIAELLGASDAPAALAALIASMDELGVEGAAGAAALARVMDERGLTDQAETLATAVLDNAPEQPIALGIAAAQAYKAGQFEQARTLVQNLLNAYPDHAGGHELRGNLLAASGRFPGAAQHWQFALDLDAHRPKLFMRLGSYLAVAGEYENAYELLQRATAAGVATADSLYHLGVAAYRRDRIVEGIAALHMALQRDPDRGMAHAMLARCYMRTGRDDLALIHDARAMELLPNHWPSVLAVAHAALMHRQFGEAVEVYTNVARLRPDLAEALYGLGLSLQARDMLSDSAAVLLRACELQPTNATIRCALARTYIRADKLWEANQAIDAARDLAPDSLEVERCAQELFIKRLR